MRTPFVSSLRSALRASRVSLPLCSAICLGSGLAQAQTVAPITTTPVFQDDFSTATLNRINWNVTGPEEFLQRTTWGKAPFMTKDADGTTYARLYIDSYDPNQPGVNFLGTQMTSLSRWNVGTGVEFEVRFRSKNLPPGLVLGVFPYGDTGVYKDTYQKNEIDYEFLTRQGGNYVWTNIWNDWNPLRSGNLNSKSSFVSTPNWNGNTWNVFKLRWYPDRTEWIANDKIIRTEKTVVPGSPMGIWLNLWAANSGWDLAYSSAITPVTTAAAKKIYNYDVDYVKVRPIPKTASQGTIGTGTGLAGAYYDTVDFQTLKTVRLDPRVNFDWGTFAPDPRMGTDTYSVRWTGSIQPQFSETYTFTLNNSDGARLWINNKLVIDNWADQTKMVAKTATVSMTAGHAVPIRVDYYNKTSAAGVQLFWSSPSTAKCLVPQSQLYSTGQCASPTFSPGPRTYPTAQNVTITSTTSGATIHYTLDGTVPTEDSAVLAAGATLHIGIDTVVRASAYLAGHIPSTPRTGQYLFTFKDTTAPAVAITSPAANVSVKVLPTISGTVSDTESGVSRVDMVISRLSDGYCWTGTTWVNSQYGVKATISGTKWTVSSDLPTGSNLPVGKYGLKAVAYDVAGNSAAKSQTITVVAASAISAIQAEDPEATPAPSEEVPATVEAAPQKSPSAGSF